MSVVKFMRKWSNTCEMVRKDAGAAGADGDAGGDGHGARLRGLRVGVVVKGHAGALTHRVVIILYYIILYHVVRGCAAVARSKSWRAFFRMLIRLLPSCCLMASSCDAGSIL